MEEMPDGKRSLLGVLPSALNSKIKRSGNKKAIPALRSFHE